jgi:asparagine synthase (glutamine-hydrolysing)
MCGLVAYVNPRISIETAQNMFQSGQARGPDDSAFHVVNSNFWVGFHRLAINGVSDSYANQPLSLGSLLLVCNGEIYNSQELYEQMGVKPYSASDCEVILHLFQRYGIEQTVHMIDASEFAFVLYDTSQNQVYAARDPFGVRPLYVGTHKDMLMFSSELKSISLPNTSYQSVQPATIVTLVDGEWSSKQYYALPSIQRALNVDVVSLLQKTLYDAVMKRVKNTERPIACLLSGGLDSSIITALVVQCRRELGYHDRVETYSIGMEGGEDLRYANIVAEFLGTSHTTVINDEDAFFNAIPEVIYNIESYDTTTVRASVGNYLVARHISKNSDAKVIFNGDGADEVAGGYLYFRAAPDAIAADGECRRLLKDIHCFDALRSDRSIGCNGLEARTPFLDRAFVQMYLSLPLEVRFPNGGQEKQLLREAFGHLLPRQVATRTKEAFSDGVSALKRSWFQIVQDKISDDFRNEFKNYQWARKQWFNPPTTAEQYYYRHLYNQHYMQAANTIPYFWMPRFVSAHDASARTLAGIYKQI